MHRAYALMLLALAAPSAWCVSPANAATYQVVACGAAPGFVAPAWAYEDTGAVGQFEHGSGCGSPGTYGGLWIRDDLDPLSSAAGETAYWTFTAPAATTVTSVTYSRFLETIIDPDWRAELRAGETILESCGGDSNDTECTLGADGGASTTFSGLSAGALRVGIRCAPLTMDAICEHGAELHRVKAVIYSATVTINDPTLPTVSAPTGALAQPRWLRGQHAATASASDSTGIDTIQLLRGDAPVATDDRACDYTKAAPCANPGANTDAQWPAIDTATWPDGEHQIRTRATDAANNVALSTPVTVRTDNTAPAPPTGLTVEGGDGWSNNPTRALAWTLPEGQASPIVGATIRRCLAGACTDEPASSVTSGHVTASADGEWSVSVWLRDEAGNESAANAAAATLRYDGSAPPAPRIGIPDNVDGTFVMHVAVDDPGPAAAPIVRFDGELCDVNGANCSQHKQSPTHAFSPAGVISFSPPPGTWQVRVRAVDQAGNVGATSTTLITLAPPPSGISQEPVAALRKTPTLRITRARVRGGRLSFAGTITRGATGTLTVTYDARTAKGTKRVTKRVKVRAGRWRGSVRLSKLIAAARSGRLRASYSGDKRFGPRRTSRTIRPAR